MATKRQKKGVSAVKTTKKTKKTSRLKSILPKKAPKKIEGKEDIDAILGLPSEPLPEIKGPSPVVEREVIHIEKDMESRRAQMLAEIKRQQRDEDAWEGKISKQKKEVDRLLDEKSRIYDEIQEMKRKSAEVTGRRAKKLIEDYENRKKTLEDAILKLESDYEKLKAIHEKSMARMKADYEELEARQKQHQARESEMYKKNQAVQDIISGKESEVKELSKEIEGLKEAKAVLAQERDALQAGIARFRKENEEVLGAKARKRREELVKKEAELTELIKRLEMEKSEFDAKNSEYMEKERAFIEKNKELADKTVTIEKREEALENDLKALEENKAAALKEFDDIKVKEAMLRAQAKELRKDFESVGKEWEEKDRLFKEYLRKIKDDVKPMKALISRLEKARDDNNKLIALINSKHDEVDEKNAMLEQTKAELILEKENLARIHDDMSRSRQMLENEEASIIARVKRLEGDEAKLKEKENSLVARISELESNMGILKDEEKKVVAKLKELMVREKNVQDAEQRIRHAKKTLERDYIKKHDDMKKIEDEWKVRMDMMERIRSAIDSEKTILDEVAEMSDDVRNLRAKEDEVVRLVKHMESSHRILTKSRTRAEKAIERMTAKEAKFNEVKKGLKAQEKELDRKLRLNMKLEEKRQETERIAKTLPQLKRDITRVQKQYEKEAARLEKVTMESVAKREMLKDFEARLKEKEERLKVVEETLVNREQVLVNMEYDVIREEDQLEDIEFRNYMDKELSGNKATADLYEGLIEGHEAPVPESGTVPRTADNITMLIEQARQYLNDKDIDKAHKLYNEIERVIKRQDIPKEDAKRIDYDMMELKTDLKLAKLV